MLREEKSPRRRRCCTKVFHPNFDSNSTSREIYLPSSEGSSGVGILSFFFGEGEDAQSGLEEVCGLGEGEAVERDGSGEKRCELTIIFELLVVITG
jgi:hypothetical protein